MENIKIYEADNNYIDYLSKFSEHLFHNSDQNQANSRKYIGVILNINGLNYFAPLSSFKKKHAVMRETVDFIKIKHYSVININNMFPIPEGLYSYVDISRVKDLKYRSLLLAEYRVIKHSQNKIRKNAKEVYNHKIKNKNATSLARRCNDFLLLEEKCRMYKK